MSAENTAETSHHIIKDENFFQGLNLGLQGEGHVNITEFE